MGYSNGRVFKPVSLADIQAAVGSSSPHIDVLCLHPSIDIWAKYKPLDSTSEQELTEADRANLGYGIIAQSYDVTTSAGRKAMLNAAMANSVGWSYKRPTTRARILDFDEYITNAKCPFWIERSGTNYDLDIAVGQYQGLPAGNIQIADITRVLGFDYQEIGYGFLYRKAGDTTDPYHEDAYDGNGNLKYRAIISGVVQDWDVPLALHGIGTYDVCCYLTAKQNDQYFILPAGGISVNVVTRPVEFTITDFYAYASSPTAKWSYSFTINANERLTAATANVTIYDWNDKPLLSTNFSVPVIAAGGSQTFGEDGIEIPAEDVSLIVLQYKTVTEETMIEINDSEA